MKGDKDATLEQMYPFRSNYMKINLSSEDEDSSLRLHFLDEGKGKPVIMIHGGLTWSFLYRNLVSKISQHRRVIVPDMLGSGLSEKPSEEVNLTLNLQVEVLQKFINKLQLDEFDLIVHGWGATSGLAYALENQAKIRKIIALNGLAFSVNGTRMMSLFSRTALFNLIMVRLTNGFLRLFMHFYAPEMRKDVKEAYLLPYSDYHSRFGIQNFLNEIPFFNMQNPDSLYSKLSLRIAELYAKDVLIIFCQQDSLTGDRANGKWRQRLPNARYVNFKSQGLFMLEEPDNEVIKFLDDELR